MWKRTALLVAVLAFALPALAGEPSNLVQKNAYHLAPKATAPKLQKNLKGPNSVLIAGQRPGEHTSLVFGKENVTNLSGGAGSGSSPGKKTSTSQLTTARPAALYPQVSI
jgi:hypothetical protein